MHWSKTLIFLSCSTTLVCASSLAVYQDSSEYRFSPERHFIGFTSEGVHATCNGETIALEVTLVCPKKERLCQERTRLRTTAQKREAVKATRSVLNTFVSLPKLSSVEAEKWIDAARRIGVEEAKLSSKEALLDKAYLFQSKAFQKQAPSQEARTLKHDCLGQVELTLPYGQILFSTYYEATLQKEKKIKVTHYLSVTNRSGIDIEADHAFFYYRQAHHIIYPVHFSPWIVHKSLPHPQKRYSKSLALSRVANNEQTIAPTPLYASNPPQAHYLSARAYTIDTLSLPSTGEKIDVPVTTWERGVECELRAYPYRSNRVFTVCSFSPKTEIVSHQWKVKKANMTLNEKAVGEYEEGLYRLYTQSDPEVKIVRKPLVKRERTSGIFGNTLRKRDGYTVTLSNTSNQTKEIRVIERIPTSTTDEIKVKLLSVKSEKKVHYTVSKEGKIEMHIRLKANETRKIEVRFEMAYDKALKIRY